MISFLFTIDVNPGITSSFATAAYRLHTLIQGTINLQNAENKVFDKVQLRTQFNNPQILYKNGALDLLIGGLTGQPAQHGIKYLNIKTYLMLTNVIL